MTESMPAPLLDREVVDSLDVAPRRLSKITLFWYLKSLPERSVGAILLLIPIVIGSVLALGLLIDWGVHRIFSQDQIEKALDYDLESIDEQTIQRWIESPAVTDWLAGLSTWVIVVPVVTVVGVVVGYFVMRILQWRRIRFGIDDGVIWMSGGLFSTWIRRLPITHVQSVEIRSTLLQRLLTLRGVAISSAAPEGKNATIELLAVRRGVAAELTATMERAFGVTIATPEAADSDAERIASVGWRQLLVAAANSFEVRLSIFSLYFAYQLLGQGPLRRWRDRTIDAVTTYTERHTDLAHLALVALGALVFFWVFSALIFVATFARFRLSRVGQLALIEHGLLTRRWRTVLLPHVQALTFVESPAQQLTHAGALRMTLPGTTRDEIERSMLLPSVPREHAFGVLDRLFADLTPGTGAVFRQLESSMQRLPPGSRRPYLLRWIYRLAPVSLLLCLLLAATPAGVSAWWGFLPLVVLGPVGMIYGYVRFRDAGWQVDDRGRLIVRARAFSRTTRVAPKRRLIWMRFSVLRLLSGRYGTFTASVAGAGSRPGIVARLLGHGLIARSNSRFRVMVMPREAAIEVLARLRPDERAPSADGGAGSPDTW